MKTELWIAVGLILILIGSHWLAYERGRQAVEAEDQEAVAALDATIKTLRIELEAARGKRELVYRDRIKVIRDQTDTCLDRPMPGPVVGQLRADDPLPP